MYRSGVSDGMPIGFPENTPRSPMALCKFASRRVFFFFSGRERRSHSGR